MAQHNSFIDGIGLTETNSLIHLLDNNDTDDNNEAPIIKHSAYYGENEFSTMLAYKAGLSILSGNIQSINAKFDDFESFVSRVNTSHPISAICLQECWLDEKDTDSINLFNLSDYRPISRVVIGREFDYISRLIYVRYCLTNTTLCLRRSYDCTLACNYV